MSLRLLAPLAIGLALTLIPSPAVAGDLEASTDLGKKLLAEGDAKADGKEPTEAVLRYKKAFEQLLPGMRKLPFHHEVKRDVTKREDMRAFLLKEIDEDKTPAEFRGDELGMKALGLIPADLDLKETMVRVLTEEIAAFYDTKTETMHLIEEPPNAKPPTFLERLLGKTSGFDKDQNKTVIAHELTHALTDQHFDIDALQSAAKGDDDVDLALSAVIEGDATLTMFAAQAEDWKGTKIVKMRAADLDFMFRLLGPLMTMGSGASLREAPPILSESLIFPYFKGMVFCAHLANKGGWSAVDGAYREPPLSTEQILHPEKYRDDPDVPTAVDLGPLDAGEGWKEAGRNVVGEMQMAVLLGRRGGREAAAGWDGDRFAVFEGPEKRLGLVWLTTWDTEDDAREFAKSYLRVQTTKIGRDAPAADADAASSRRPLRGAIFALDRRGRDVAVVEGFPAAATDSLIEAAFRAKKTEKVRALPKDKGKEGDKKANGDDPS